MATLSEAKILECWKKAPKRKDVDETRNQYRTGADGALIRWGDYGNKSLYGWNIDHKKPISQGGTNANSNLRAMQWKNNIAKGNNYEENGICYYRSLVFKKELETNVFSETGMSFTNNEARDI